MMLALAFAVVVAAADANAEPSPAPNAPVEPSAPAPAFDMQRPVVDNAGVLGDDTESALRQKIHDHLDKSGVAIGVVIVPSLEGKKLGVVVDDAVTAFQQGFGAGKPSVLVVIALQDRTMRISGDPRLRDDNIFTDDDVTRLTTEATKSFASGDCKGGVTNLVDGIIAKTPRAPRDRAFIIRVTLIASASVILLALIAAGVMRRRRSAPSSSSS